MKTKSVDCQKLEVDSGTDLNRLESESQDVIIFNTSFDIRAKLKPLLPTCAELSADGENIFAECQRILKRGGMLFVYGLPQELPLVGEFLDFCQSEDSRMVFKYWIALDIDSHPRQQTLQATHLGLLMYLKTGVRSSNKFHLNTKDVRIPHGFCSSCGLNLKDWGGKKHLMNPNGTAIADVWRDFPRTKITSDQIPGPVQSRIVALTNFPGAKFLRIKTRQSLIQKGIKAVDSWSAQSSYKLAKLQIDKAYEGECVSFLKAVSHLHPDGVFDMVFADPPYNLDKKYSVYADSLAEKEYIKWCNDWLLGMAKTLKPGGALFVLNLPKWCIHHAVFLQKHLEFRHWIVWDALSDPRGKIMPAHYGLLYFTKPGENVTFNYSGSKTKPDPNNVSPPDAPKYCLRAQCVKARKKNSDNEKVELSDVWFDIHRIKHKRDRDSHPCQLPEKLMERLIRLSTNPGGVVFDPFSGAGTTAIASKKLGRHFVVTDIDPNYVRITEEKVKAMELHADLFGHYQVPRATVKRSKQPASKKEVETQLQSIAQELGEIPTEDYIASAHPDLLKKIDLLYPNRQDAIKRSKVALTV